MISGSSVLFIDGDREESRALAAALQAHKVRVLQADDAPGGLRLFLKNNPDFVVVDLEVKRTGGWQIVQRVRELADTSVIVIASHASNEHVSRAFDLRVDGFLVRPFEPADLLARLVSIQARGNRDDERWVYRRDGISVDFRSCEVKVDGRPVYLTSTEYRLLTYLIQRRGWVVSHDQILNHVWGSDYPGDKDQVKLYIWYLRRKIEADPRRPTTILTRRGLGYTFVA
jgi:two-component system KDP operon response regulator KdpE